MTIAKIVIPALIIAMFLVTIAPAAVIFAVSSMDTNIVVTGSMEGVWNVYMDMSVFFAKLFAGQVGFLLAIIFIIIAIIAALGFAGGMIILFARRARG